MITNKTVFWVFQLWWTRLSSSRRGPEKRQPPLDPQSSWIHTARSVVCLRLKLSRAVLASCLRWELRWTNKPPPSLAESSGKPTQPPLSSAGELGELIQPATYSTLLSEPEKCPEWTVCTAQLELALSLPEASTPSGSGSAPPQHHTWQYMIWKALP